MKFITIILTGLLVLTLSTPAFTERTPKDPKKLSYAELRFQPSKPQAISLDKGQELFLLENHDVPFVRVFIVIGGGSLLDPRGQEGLTALAMRLLKSGGTATLTPEAVEDRLDELGSNISSSADLEYSMLSLWTLSKNFNPSWKLLTEMLCQPRFDAERLDAEKKSDLEAIRRRWDEPADAADIVFNELLYGRDYPEARRSTSVSIQSIERHGLADFYRHTLMGRRLLIAISGDFDATAIRTHVRRDLAAWPKAATPAPLTPPAQLAVKPGIYLVDKPDMNQAVLMMGHLGIQRLDPDNVELTVLNFILGAGGFNSRIMREVRSHRGLAYSAYGMIGMGRDRGAFTCFTQTKAKSLSEAVRVIRDIIRDISATPVFQEELDTAKRYEVNSFVFRFESASALLFETMLLRLYGYPGNYLDTYIQRIQQVTAEKVLQMAQRTLRPDGLVILVLGPKAQLLEPLRELNLGQVSEITLTAE